MSQKFTLKKRVHHMEFEGWFKHCLGDLEIARKEARMVASGEYLPGQARLIDERLEDVRCRMVDLYGKLCGPVAVYRSDD